MNDISPGNTPPPLFSVKRMLPFIVIILVSVLGFVFLRDYLNFDQFAKNQEALQAWRDGNYVLASLVFIMVYILVVAFSLPGAAIVSLAGGFLFGLFPGALYNIGSATIGAVAIFMAARMGFGEALSAKMDSSKGAVGKIKEGLKTDEISYLLIMRLVPAVPFFVANLIPALVGVNLRRFVWTTFVGIIPGGVVYTWVGVGLAGFFARGETPNLGIIFEWQILGPLLGLAGLAMLPVILKKFKGK
ncbi:MAG: TVP38/TMEM64 family protein [Proteobacteria bacterium]|nr:TVP38/TMEM64 family protein [Pseudomonadota bacterium]